MALFTAHIKETANVLERTGILDKEWVGVMGNSWIKKLGCMFVAEICMDCYNYLPFCHAPKAESTYVGY